MARAGRRRAPEPPGRRLQRHPAALARQAAQHAGAAARQTPRDDAAIVTPTAWALPAGRGPHAIRRRQDLADCEASGG